MLGKLLGLIPSLIISIIIIVFFISIVFPIIFHKLYYEMKLKSTIKDVIAAANTGSLQEFYIDIDPLEYDVIFDFINDKIRVVRCPNNLFFLKKLDNSCLDDCDLIRYFDECESIGSYSFSGEVSIISEYEHGIKKYILDNVSEYDMYTGTLVYKTHVKIDDLKDKGEELSLRKKYNLKKISLFSFNYWKDSASSLEDFVDGRVFLSEPSIFGISPVLLEIKTENNKIKFIIGSK